MSFHVVFTPDGIPGWIGFEPRGGSEELPETRLVGEEEIEFDIVFLAAHMRLPSGEWVLRPAAPPPGDDELAAQAAAELQGARLNAAQVIDDLVTAARLRFVTQLPGQEAIYLAKEAEARTYVATMPEPDSLEDFPYLAAEVGITAATARELALIWLQKGAQFRGLGAATENLRMGARKALTNAATPQDVAELLNSLSADLDALG
ncbi:hypothetical protein [Tabrizicola sp.]|uniref:hypothetical protein n=1 Tax=Tabrizicola sp. TaxID=2005166 RepID=UPI0025EC2D10|nr:hypothetical protein [Tabrizicola sp.]